MIFFAAKGFYFMVFLVLFAFMAFIGMAFFAAKVIFFIVFFAAESVLFMVFIALIDFMAFIGISFSASSLS